MGMGMMMLLMMTGRIDGGEGVSWRDPVNRFPPRTTSANRERITENGARRRITDNGFISRGGVEKGDLRCGRAGEGFCWSALR